MAKKEAEKGLGRGLSALLDDNDGIPNMRSNVTMKRGDGSEVKIYDKTGGEPRSSARAGARSAESKPVDKRASSSCAAHLCAAGSRKGSDRAEVSPEPERIIINGSQGIVRRKK